MRIIYYSVAIVGGIILTIAGAYLAGIHYKEKQYTEITPQEKKVFPESAWLQHFNDHQSKKLPRGKTGKQ